MKFLLDTQVVVWLTTTPAKIPERVRRALFDAEATFVSVLSAWEYEAKRVKRPDQLALPFDQLMAPLPVEGLSFDWACRSHARDLPLIHKDPFDRMLIAQALASGLTLVTADEHIRHYPVPTLW